MWNNVESAAGRTILARRHVGSRLLQIHRVQPVQPSQSLHIQLLHFAKPDVPSTIRQLLQQRRHQDFPALGLVRAARLENYILVF